MTQETDKELLELAAKAIGLPERGWMGPAFMYVKDNTFTDWDPLTDDGDALRLLVKLELLVDANGMHSRVCFPFGEPLAYEVKGNDPYAATRRAIVRAAAEIGRAM
jgi:hypothetical protein